MEACSFLGECDRLTNEPRAGAQQIGLLPLWACGAIVQKKKEPFPTFSWRFLLSFIYFSFSFFLALDICKQSRKNLLGKRRQKHDFHSGKKTTKKPFRLFGFPPKKRHVTCRARCFYRKFPSWIDRISEKSRRWQFEQCTSSTSLNAAGTRTTSALRRRADWVSLLLPPSLPPSLFLSSPLSLNVSRSLSPLSCTWKPFFMIYYSSLATPPPLGTLRMGSPQQDIYLKWLYFITSTSLPTNEAWMFFFFFKKIYIHFLLSKLCFFYLDIVHTNSSLRGK